MENDLIYDVTKALEAFAPKDFLEARAYGGMTVRRWDKEARIDVYRGMAAATPMENVIEVATQAATALRVLGYHIHVSKLDEYHSSMHTFNPRSSS